MFFVRIEVIPTLTACLSWPRIPRNIECLEPAAWKPKQILLKWRYSEGVVNFELCDFSVGTLCADPVFSILPKEGGLLAIFREDPAVKAAKNGRLSGGLH